MTDQSQRSPVYKYVDFDLPFVLFLKDSLGDQSLAEWAEAYAKGARPLPYSRYAPSAEKPGVMIIGGGFPVFVPPADLAPYYVIRLPSIVVGLRTLRRVNPHRPTILMGELPGDRSGRASFSSVRVMFDLKTVPIEAHWDMTFFCATSVAAINHFIDHYRVLADRPYITRVTMATIQEFHLTSQFDDGPNQSQEYGSGGGPLTGFGGAISDDLEERLRAAIEAPDPPMIEATLDANIRDHLQLEEWRLAVVETAVLFEAWLARFLRTRFQTNGLSPSDIDSKFLAPNGQPRSVSYLAKNLVREATGYDFESAAECKRWEAAVRDLRNAVVHGERFDVTRGEATDAHGVATAAISLIATK